MGTICSTSSATNSPDEPKNKQTMQPKIPEVSKEKVCAGLGYRINPDPQGNRLLKSVNGENKNFYQVVP